VGFSTLIRREWGAVTFVLTVLVGMIVVPLALYFGNVKPAPVSLPPAVTSSPAVVSPSPAATPSPAPSPTPTPAPSPTPT
jgi:hypothetical protein